MKTQTHPLHILPQSLEGQTLLNEPFRDKVAIGVAPELSQLKSSRYPERNTPPVRYYTIERRGDNMLYCKETGQKLPSTPRGKLDKKQLEIEIAHKRLIGFQ